MKVIKLQMKKIIHVLYLITKKNKNKGGFRLYQIETQAWIIH